MAELRYNPFKRDWLMVASHRQNRPQMPADWCPFCPGSGRVPERFEVWKYDNDFPALSPTPPAPDDVANDFFQTMPAYGKCEVILYSPDHTATLPALPLPHVEALVELWTERSQALAQDPAVRYVFVFENRGKEVGVTMPHPHGQIYAYPFVPKKVGDKLAACRDHHVATGRNLVADWLDAERADSRRVIFEDEHFTVLLPFFAENAYGISIVARRNVLYLWDLTAAERASLARTVRNAVGMLDALFDMPFPYMMCMQQGPLHGEDASDCYRFHIEFFTPLRSADKQQFNASSETGAGAHCNPTAPEEKAVELRAAYDRFCANDKEAAP